MSCSVPINPAEFKQRSEEILIKVREVAVFYKYPLEVSTSQRTMGPCPGVPAPPHGTEIFVTKIPREVFEDTLFPYFKQVGNIYKHRLMMSPSGISNRGCAYITYENSTAAKMAIMNYHDKEIVPGCKLAVRQSVDNRRIFIGGIPETKTKTQVWHELERVGMKNIVDVIMYRSYIDRNKNRGFVFVEFSTHEDAAVVRVDFKHSILFGNRVQVDWSAPLHAVDDFTMRRVKKVFLRNLPVTLSRSDFADQVIDIIGSSIPIEKVYKYRDYAFLHFCTRRDAQRGLSLLKNYYKDSDVEVAWAKPAPPKNENVFSAGKAKKYEDRENNNSSGSEDMNSFANMVDDLFDNNNFNNSGSSSEDMNLLASNRMGELFDSNFNEMALIQSILGKLEL